MFANEFDIQHISSPIAGCGFELWIEPDAAGTVNSNSESTSDLTRLRIHAMAARVDIVSIGAQARNAFWGEQAAVRAEHATTAVIRDGNTTILVDPALPAELLAYRLDERTGLKPAQIDIVFLTTFRPVHRLGLALFEKAEWLIGAAEREAILETMRAAQLATAPAGAEIENELALLERTKPAPDKLTPLVSLFPSPGATPGTCGLLVSALRTIIVAGDAVVSREHYEAGRVFERAWNADVARQSFAEIVEIAEAIVPGHDNIFWTA
jgi:glyoxylase-like metal-dependent hydrolase (beta-lactamase superfamily II)